MKLSFFYNSVYGFQFKQLHNLRDQMNVETNKLRNEEIQKTTVEERLEKALHDLHHMKNEHMTVNYELKFVYICKFN